MPSKPSPWMTRNSRPSAVRWVDFGQQLDACQQHAAIVAEGLIVIARHIDHTRAAFHLGENGVDHAAMCRAPEPASLEPPEIDDIADEVERAAVVVGEKIGQQLGFAAGRAEVDIGDEYRAVVARQIGRETRLGAPLIEHSLRLLAYANRSAAPRLGNRITGPSVLCRDSM